MRAVKRRDHRSASALRQFSFTIVNVLTGLVQRKIV